MSWKFCPTCGAPLYPLLPHWLTCRRGHHWPLITVVIALVAVFAPAAHADTYDATVRYWERQVSHNAGPLDVHSYTVRRCNPRGCAVGWGAQLRRDEGRLVWGEAACRVTSRVRCRARSLKRWTTPGRQRLKPLPTCPLSRWQDCVAKKLGPLSEGDYPQQIRFADL